MTPVRVLVADDEPLVRAGLRAILTSDPEIDVVAEAPDGRQAVEQALAHRPDVVLMDIRMPELDGLAAISEIRAVRPAQRVVVLTTFGEEAYVRHAVAIGVDGFLLKSGDPYDLLRGVRAVAAGGACLAPSVASQVLLRLRGSGGPGGPGGPAATAVAALPGRERDVLRLLARGLSNGEIAAELFLAEGTVKGYLSSLFGHLAVRNRVEAALVAWQAGWGADGAT